MGKTKQARLDPEVFDAMIKFFLEDTRGVEADLTTRGSLHPMLRKDIEQSAVRVF